MPKHKTSDTYLAFGDLKVGDYFRFPKTPQATRFVKRTRGWYVDPVKGKLNRTSKFTMVFLADPLLPEAEPVRDPNLHQAEKAPADCSPTEAAYNRLYRDVEMVAAAIVFMRKMFPEVAAPEWAGQVLALTNYPKETQPWSGQFLNT
jgi:hypothetical protein